MIQELELTGGNLSQVVRVGNTVRRSIKPWSAAIHGLLQHLEKKGFNASPRLLGIDEKGREILTYFEGEIGEGLPCLWSTATLTSAARLLREYHDATEGYISAALDDSWQFVYPDPEQHEVICHNDFAPYNLIFEQERPIALIDFDVAGPGPRLRDVAMGAYWFAPLSFSSEFKGKSLHDLHSGGQRLRLFCRTYGLELNSALIDMVEEWLLFMGTFPVEQVEAGHEEYQILIDEGHVAHWRREYHAFREFRVHLEKNLDTPS